MELIQPGVPVRGEEHPLAAETAVHGELDRVVVRLRFRIRRVGEHAILGDRGPVEQVQRLIVGGAANVVGTDVLVDERRCVGTAAG